jgi:hypothetical protein
MSARYELAILVEELLQHDTAAGICGTLGIRMFAQYTSVKIAQILMPNAACTDLLVNAARGACRPINLLQDVVFCKLMWTKCKDNCRILHLSLTYVRHWIDTGATEWFST